MRSLGDLGIGLSVVFCVFVLALAAEICYLFYWKRRRLGKSATASGADVDDMAIRGKKALHRRPSHDFVHEASLVGSFGGYPSFALSEIGDGGPDASFGESLLHSSSSQHPPSHLLFSIKEETKEDMELATERLEGTIKPNSRLHSRTPSDVLAIHFTSGSSSPAASLDTPVTTPTSSPPPYASQELQAPMPKLSPCAACAVKPIISSGKSSSPIAEIHISAGYKGSFSPIDINGRGRTSLRLLFQHSPLLQKALPQSPAPALLPNSPLRSLSGARAAESIDTSLPPSYYCSHHRSLGAHFRQTSSAHCHSPPQTNKPARIDV